MIAFACRQCGVKLRVKPEFAGRAAKCPGCKQSLTIPAPEQSKADLPDKQIDGNNSSVAEAGLDGGVTLAGPPPSGGRKPVRDMLAQKPAGGQRYIIESEIARGGMGAVLRAVDRDIRREVAVKFMLDQADPKKKARFVEEAQITGQLEHPNIVPIHELGIDRQKRLYFSMKMVHGRSLAQVLDELRSSQKTAEKVYSLTRLLNILVGVCNALAYAHARGVVHRDLKPANIMLGDFGEVYVMDWGLAKVLDSAGGAPVATVAADQAGAAPSAVPLPDAESSSKVKTSRQPEADLTQDGAILGTPVYMPPEQAAGRGEAVDRVSDVYSLGAILYELLTLMPPVEKDGGYLAVLMRVMENQIVPPELRAPQRARSGRIPKELAAVAMKALAKDKNQRYASVELFRRDLERFLEGRSVSAKEDSAREMVWKLVKRNKALSAAIFLFVPALVVLLGSTLLNYRAFAQAQREKEERTKQAVPAFVSSARLLANNGQLNEALKQAEVALSYDGDNVEAQLLKAQVYVAQRDFATARRELERYLRARPDDADAKKLDELCAKGPPNDTAGLVAFADVLQRQKAYGVAAILLQSVQRTVEARKPLQSLYQKQVEAAWPGLGHRVYLETNGHLRFTASQFPQVAALHPLKGMQLNQLQVRGCNQINDLTPLQGMPLTLLDLGGCRLVSDLAPLRGMQLTDLDLAGCKQVKDLGPLHGMPLTTLNLTSFDAVDLSALRGMPLRSLDMRGMPITDVAPLQGLQLNTLILSTTQIRDLTGLQGMPLRMLSLHGCPQLQDVGPLKGLPLTHLEISACGRLKDVSALEGLKLEYLQISPAMVTKGLDVIRKMKTLKTLSQEGSIRYTPEDFWRKFDAGELK